MHNTNIVDFVEQELNTKINSLQEQRELIKKVDPMNQDYKICIFAEEKKMVDKLFKGSLANSLKDAKSEYMRINNQKEMCFEHITVHMLVGQDQYFIPPQVWNSYWSK